jgi:hypothetical protein
MRSGLKEFGSRIVSPPCTRRIEHRRYLLVKAHKLLKTNYFDELVGEEIISYREYLEPNSQDVVFRDKFRNEEGSMWLALASIVLASAIGFNVLALRLTGWFERNESKSAFS